MVHLLEILEQDSATRAQVCYRKFSVNQGICVFLRVRMSLSQERTFLALRMILFLTYALVRL